MAKKNTENFKSKRKEYSYNGIILHIIIGELQEEVETVQLKGKFFPLTLYTFLNVWWERKKRLT
jgi:hypothetical protein